MLLPQLFSGWLPVTVTTQKKVQLQKATVLPHFGSACATQADDVGDPTGWSTEESQPVAAPSESPQIAWLDGAIHESLCSIMWIISRETSKVISIIRSLFTALLTQQVKCIRRLVNVGYKDVNGLFTTIMLLYVIYAKTSHHCLWTLPIQIMDYGLLPVYCSGKCDVGIY